MPEGIGYDIAGDPQEDANVVGWKDFLKRPENLATALVLAAMVTSPKQRGQSSLNKALVSGAGALGFRGALESGVADRRRQGTLDQQAAEAQAAEIAQGAEQNRIAADQVGVQREGVAVQRTRAQTERDALTTPPQLHPSQVSENNAQAAYLNALAQGQDPTKGQSWVMLELQRELGRADQFGTEPDIGSAMLRGRKLDLMFRLMNEGRFSTEKMTPEEKAEAESLGVVLPGAVAPDHSGAGNGGGKPAPQASENFRQSGKFFDQLFTGAEGGANLAVAEMRKDPTFAEMEDTVILDKVAQAREFANNKEALASASIEDLENLLMSFRRVMSSDEIKAIRKAMQTKKGTKQPFRDLMGSGGRNL